MTFLIAFNIAIIVAHSEYLTYVQITGSIDYIHTSYLIKWTLIILSLAFYYLSRPRQVDHTPPERRAVNTAQTQKNGTADHEIHDSPEDDGFDFLRSKEKLERHSNKILDK